MDYARYDTHDFVRDSFFQKWVLEPDAETEVFWQNVLRSHPHLKSAVAEAKEHILLLNFQRDHQANQDFLEVWQRIREARQEQAGEEEQKVRHQEAGFGKGWYRVAAALAGLLLLLGGLFVLNREGEPTIQFATRYGETKTILLPDSSEVTLNANSTLSFREEWDRQRPREVWLKGEAFFHVQKKPQPGFATFKVHAAELTVEVLGTRFNVVNRRRGTEVVLSTGKVNLQLQQAPEEKGLILEPGEWAGVAQGGRELSRKAVDPEVYTAWRNNKLIFDKSPLREIAVLLEDNYGYQVVFTDPEVASKRFTGTIPADNIDLLFTSLSKLYDLDITRENNRLIVARQ